MTEEICGYCGLEFTPREPVRRINDVPYHSCNEPVSCLISAIQVINEMECGNCHSAISNAEEAWGIIDGKTYHYPKCYP